MSKHAKEKEKTEVYPLFTSQELAICFRGYGLNLWVLTKTFINTLCFVHIFQMLSFPEFELHVAAAWQIKLALFRLHLADSKGAVWSGVLYGPVPTWFWNLSWVIQPRVDSLKYTWEWIQSVRQQDTIYLTGLLHAICYL